MYRSRVTARWKIIAAYLTLCAVWSSTWLAIKIGLADLPPISFAGIRFLIAFVVLVAVSAGRVPLLPKRRGDWALIVSTGVTMFAINYGLLFWGELHVSSGLAAILQATIPVTGMFFAHWIIPEEPLRWKQLGGAALAIAGVAVICGRLIDHGGMLAFWGGLGISLGGAGAAFSTVLLKRRALQVAPAMLAAWQMICGAVPLLLLGGIMEGNPLRFHWSGLAISCLLYLAVIGSSLTFLLLYWLLPRIPVNKLQTISLVTPPGAVALGWLLGGEKLSLWSLAGGALVLAGVWMIFGKAEPVHTPAETEAALTR
ncbi:MAG: EamA family transporter [Verrucomicrobiota bacterium]|nr:EamA family transporter [Verrucomicrobiota bacterium]